jgi:ATP-dependent DNA helicase RecG
MGATPGVGSQKGSQKSSQKILNLLRANPEITIAELAESLMLTDRAIKKQLEKLKLTGQVIRVGPNKGGHWEVVE